jgi:hypothetical protein
MAKVFCDQRHVEETLKHLQTAGLRHSECVVLWFGRETQRGLEIEAVYRPTQMAGSDIFRIPPPAMRQIIEIISKNGWMIAAQVFPSVGGVSL